MIVKQKELSSVNRRIVVNNQQSYNRVYAVHCLRAEPRILFTAVPFIFAVILRGFVVNEVQTQQ